MPNQPATSLIAFRGGDELKAELQRIADDRGTSVSELLRSISWEYVRRYPADES